MEEKPKDILAALDEEKSAAYRLLGEAQAAGKEYYPPDNVDGLGEVSDKLFSDLLEIGTESR